MSYSTQNELLLNTLRDFYKDEERLKKVIPIINGESHISLRIIDWFATNYAKKYFVVYDVSRLNGRKKRFYVHIDYKLKLKAYSKRRFDPFCRWDRIHIPYGTNEQYVQTTIGQLNFFKWCLENDIIQYIEQHYDEIDKDMNNRNSTAKRRDQNQKQKVNKTRKKREELSISAAKTIKKQDIEIKVNFN
jgi:hypothetical protein